MALVSFASSGIPQNLVFGALQRHTLMVREELGYINEDSSNAVNSRTYEEDEEVLVHALSSTSVDPNCLRRCVDCC